MANVLPLKDSPAWQKIDKARAAYKKALIERAGEIDAVLLALIIRHHCLLVGDPGTAKSYLADLLCDLIAGQKYTRLLHPQTVIDEVVGSVSFKAYKEDRFERVPTGKLPEAQIAFLDELFNSGPQILNVLLKLLAERKWDNNGSVVNCPLETCIAASNFWNQGPETNALFDRFLIRKPVRSIQSDRGLHQLLTASDEELKPQGVEVITHGELASLNSAAQNMPVDEDAVEALIQILKELRKEGVVPGDRRRRQAMLAIKGQAVLEGDDAVTLDHFEVLTHCLWVDPKDQPDFVAEVVGRVANPAGLRIGAIVLGAEEALSNCNINVSGEVMETCKQLEQSRKKLRKIGSEKANTLAQWVKDECVRLQTHYLETDGKVNI